jgi:hypothetical protein
MILFLEDWARFPNAIPDYKTKNESFLRQAHVYKTMGIKNHLFLLALMQPELQGVDPHDPNLTLEQKAMIGLECKYNPWYFFREVVRLPAVAGPEPVKFRANRGNIALFWAFFCNIDAANIQPRQTGKSASTDCLMVWVNFIGATNTKTTMITKDDALRRANVDRLKGIRNLLPKYLVNLTREDADNQFELTCKALKNSYTTGVAQNSEAAANNLGRGLTSPILHCDEGPFINFIGTSLPAALAAGTAARDEARKYNRPYGNIFTTTAGKKDDRDGRFMYDLIHSGAVWNEAFFDCKNKRDLREMVMSNGTGGAALVNITMSHRQLGKTDEWLRDAIAIARATGEAADRDFLNVWTSGTQRSPLSTALNEAIRNSEMEVLHSEITDRYVLRWFIPEDEIATRMAEGHFVIGMDTSEAVGRDAIGFVMLDIRDLSTVAAGTYNETNIQRFGAYLMSLMLKYENTTLVIERKSTAIGLLDYLIIQMSALGIDPFKRIYNRIVDEGNDEQMRELNRRPEFRSEQFYDMRRSKFGFSTTKESRTLLYTNVLQEAAKKAGHLVRDKTLSGELRGLVEKNGRIDHVSSGHDDMVMSWLLAHWFLTHARNLSHYGIVSSHVMMAVSEMGRVLNEEELQRREQQGQLMDEIDDLLDKLKNCKEEILIVKYEHRLRFLQSQLDASGVEEVTNMDALIHQVREERQKRMRMESQQRRTTHNRSLDFQRPGFLGAPTNRSHPGLLRRAA